MQNPIEKPRSKLVTTLIETFGFSPLWASIIATFLMLLAIAAALWLWLSAPPRTLRILSGPPGSVFQRYAEAYKAELLQKHKVTLEIIPTGGSAENLQRLKAGDAELAFVQGGLIGDNPAPADIVSLGSLAHQPVWIFYRGEKMARLSELAGKRIGVGTKGGGTHALATALLLANGITGPGMPPPPAPAAGSSSATAVVPSGPPATIVEGVAEEAAKDLIAGKLDAIFLMGEAASTATLGMLTRAADVQLYHFTQADAYVRKRGFTYLNKVVLPQGSFDFARNIPGQDIALVGPTVELLAREEMHSALIDIVLSAAQKTHGRPGLLARRGEFPAPLEREFPISEDARRFYKDGLSFLYSTVGSLHLASLIKRALVVIVPLILLLIPIMRILPVAYRWSVQLRIYRNYRPLLRLERELHLPLTQPQVQEMMARLDEIEHDVDKLKVPASFAYQFYALRGHVAFVRGRLNAATATAATA